MTKTAMKNTRWELMEQRVTFIEKRTDEHLEQIESKIDALKIDEIGYRKEVKETIECLRRDFQAELREIRQTIACIQKVIYRAVGAVGAVLTIVNIVLKVWK